MQPLQKAFLSAAKTCNQRDCFESVYINSRATVLTRGIRDPPPLTLPVSKPSSQKTKTLVKIRPTPKSLSSAAAQGTVFMSRNKVFTLIPSLPFIWPTIQQSPNQTAKIPASPLSTPLPTVHFLEQAFAGADFSTEKFSAALSLISAALFQCPKIAKFSVAHFFKLSCDLRCSFSIAKSRKILRCSSSDIWKGSKLNCGEY